MKLIEKLAIDYLKSTRGYDEHYEDDYSQNNYTDMREAFESGFRSSKNIVFDIIGLMAIQIDKMSQQSEATDDDRKFGPLLCSQILHLMKKVESLGEEEVE